MENNMKKLRFSLNIRLFLYVVSFGLMWRRNLEERGWLFINIYFCRTKSLNVNFLRTNPDRLTFWLVWFYRQKVCMSFNKKVGVSSNDLHMEELLCKQFLLYISYLSVSNYSLPLVSGFDSGRADSLLVRYQHLRIKKKIINET